VEAIEQYRRLVLQLKFPARFYPEKQGVFSYQDGAVMMDSALSVNNTEAYIAAASAGLGSNCSGIPYCSK
jgi:hypothetical protein